MNEEISDTKDEMLYSMFDYAKHKEDTWMRYSMIKSFDGSDIEFKSVIIDDLIDDGFVKKRFRDEDKREINRAEALASALSMYSMNVTKPQEYSITVEGIEKINKVISKETSYLSQLINSANNDLPEKKTSMNDVPASDRLVTLNHNQPEYKEISEGLDKAIQEVKELKTNDISSDEIKSQLVSLEAARKLWDAFELTAMQYKVGIILAVERAEAKLKKSFKLVKGQLLMEAIKAFYKSFEDGNIL